MGRTFPSKLARCAIEGCEREPVSAFPTPLASPLCPAGICAEHSALLDAAMEAAAEIILREPRFRPVSQREVA